MALPPGWTSNRTTRWELRRGDPTTIIKFNIDTIAGIGSVSEVRDWLLGQGYRIDKEWWEQNDFYVIRIWGTISPMWWEQHWGPNIKNVLTPPPGYTQPSIPQPKLPPGRPPQQPVPQPGLPPQGPCSPSPNRWSKTGQPPVPAPDLGNGGAWSYDPNYPGGGYSWDPSLPAPYTPQLPADIYWLVWNFMFNNLANVQLYIDFFFPLDPLEAEHERQAKIAAYYADIDAFWRMTQQAYAIWHVANPWMAYIDFAVEFILTPRGPNRPYIDDPNPAWVLS